MLRLPDIHQFVFTGTQIIFLLKTPTRLYKFAIWQDWTSQLDDRGLFMVFLRAIS